MKSRPYILGTALILTALIGIAVYFLGRRDEPVVSQFEVVEDLRKAVDFKVLAPIMEQYQLTFSRGFYFPAEDLVVLNYWGEDEEAKFFLAIRQGKNNGPLEQYEAQQGIEYISGADGMKFGQSDEHRTKRVLRFQQNGIEILLTIEGADMPPATSERILADVVRSLH